MADNGRLPDPETLDDTPIEELLKGPFGLLTVSHD